MTVVRVPHAEYVALRDDRTAYVLVVPGRADREPPPTVGGTIHVTAHGVAPHAAPPVVRRVVTVDELPRGEGQHPYRVVGVTRQGAALPPPGVPEGLTHWVREQLVEAEAMAPRFPESGYAALAYVARRLAETQAALRAATAAAALTAPEGASYALS